MQELFRNKSKQAEFGQTERLVQLFIYWPSNDYLQSSLQFLYDKARKM